MEPVLVTDDESNASACKTSRQQEAAREAATALGIRWEDLNRAQRRKMTRDAAAILDAVHATGDAGRRTDGQLASVERLRDLHHGRITAKRTGRKGGRR